MIIDFWSEEYFLRPNLDELYNYVQESPEKAMFFSTQLEESYGEDLFYQLCPKYFDTSQYEQCEIALNNAFSEILKQEQMVAYATDRFDVNNRRTKKLTGLEKHQLIELKQFCGCQQKIASNDDFRKLSLCTTRGFASSCALLVDSKIIILMQDIHGCIMFNDKTNVEGLKRIVDILQNSTFVVTPLSTNTSTGDGSVVS